MEWLKRGFRSDAVYELLVITWIVASPLAIARWVERFDDPVGWAAFNCTYALSLARPVQAVRALLPAVLVTLAVGVPLSLGLGSGYAVMAFAAGAAVFVLTSTRVTAGLLRSADYHYFASI